MLESLKNIFSRFSNKTGGLLGVIIQYLGL